VNALIVWLVSDVAVLRMACGGAISSNIQDLGPPREDASTRCALDDQDELLRLAIELDGSDDALDGFVLDLLDELSGGQPARVEPARRRVGQVMGNFWDQIEAKRLGKNQRSMANIIDRRLHDLPSEKRRAKKVLTFQRRLQTALGEDDLSVLLDLETLASERLRETMRVAWTVGWEQGVTVGWRDGVPEADLVAGLAATLSAHPQADPLVALAHVLRSRLIAAQELS